MAKKLNFKSFQEYLVKDKKIQRSIINIVEPKVESEKYKLIQEFESHPVSSEISSGPGGSNVSGTLGGYGNLFSFIGFSGGDPVSAWSNFLRKAIFLNKKINTEISGDRIVFNLSVQSVTDQDLLSIARMPWEGGRSWIKAIETSISGFSFYISKMGAGRSGGGLQSKNQKKSGGSFTPVPYWSKMWGNFIKNINQG